VSGNGISWAICKSAPPSRHKTTPSTPPLSFLQAGCPSCHPTNPAGVTTVASHLGVVCGIFSCPKPSNFVFLHRLSHPQNRNGDVKFKGKLILASASHTHTHPFNGSFSGTTQVSRYQKGKTNLDFTEARESERQWHQLSHMQVSTLL